MWKCSRRSNNRTVGQRLKAIDPAGIMSPRDATRIHGALHCVCIWNRGAFLSQALPAAAQTKMTPLEGV